MQDKAAAINRLADKFQPEAAAQFGSAFNATEWKRDFGSRLMYQSLDALTSASSAKTLSAAQMELFNAGLKPALKHATDNNWTLHLITPCRIVDTRFGGGGLLGPSARNWAASTTTPADIANQGGNAGGCGDFPKAMGFLLYVTAVPIDCIGTSFLTVRHDAGTPSTATMNFACNNIANFAITANNTAGVGDGSFWAYASRNTHVVIDLIGWAGVQTPEEGGLWAVIDTAGATARSSHVTSSQRFGTGTFEVVFDRDVTGCAYVGGLGGTSSESVVGQFSATQRISNVNAIFVETFDSAGTFADKAFHVVIHCPQAP